MTREERQEVLAPKDGGSIGTTVGKALTRKVVNGIDCFTDLVEPLNSKCTGKDARTAAMNILEGAWNMVTGWF